MQRVDARGATSLCLIPHPEETESILDPPKHCGGIVEALPSLCATTVQPNENAHYRAIPYTSGHLT